MNGSTDSPVYDDAGRLIGLIPVFRENAIAAIEAGKTEEAAEEISKDLADEDIRFPAVRIDFDCVLSRLTGLAELSFNHIAKA